MIGYLIQRLGTMAVTLLAISALVFVIINLPPGNYMSNRIAEMQASGEAAGIQRAEEMMAEYSLDKPVWQQYLIWIGALPGPTGFSGLLQGDFGWSFELERPVIDIVGETAALTAIVNLAALVFVYVVALPLGAIAAVRAGSWIDYLASFIGYIGLATPNFLLALILLTYGARYFDIPAGGLMHREFEGEPMSWAKLGSILTHLIVPTIVIGTSAAAAVMRRLRANLMDELHKPYVETARAKGVPPVMRTIRYPLRMALNPFVADIGNLAPQLVSGSVMVSVVMSLPTLGPVLLHSLKSQDIFMSGFVLLFVSVLTLVGMLISDILLVLLDPRIRLKSKRRGA
ncbi:ABC transporter permease [Paralimibaculum aggregatum]|uniref:ABC transporter permease n=1 Tax=Paralimibaculum aggregatum TaxID=3036245 RepID=A0ABQ6LR23_9RHOB|nr:ABC transporter permease [Limibaculum sp. NKW23]GMG83798.1 ABC transporter permease [Limibaculum sp. NKW23]